MRDKKKVSLKNTKGADNFVYLKTALGLNLWPEQGIRHPIKKTMLTMLISLWETKKQSV